MIGELADLCAEKKINQVVLPDGTCVIMNPLAFFSEVLPEMTQKAIQSDINTVDNRPGLDENLDESILFASARG